MRKREKRAETSPLKSKKIRRDSLYSQWDCVNSVAFLFYRDVGNGMMSCGVHCKSKEGFAQGFEQKAP